MSADMKSVDVTGHGRGVPLRVARLTGEIGVAVRPTLDGARVVVEGVTEADQSVRTAGELEIEQVRELHDRLGDVLDEFGE